MWYVRGLNLIVLIVLLARWHCSTVAWALTCVYTYVVLVLYNHAGNALMTVATGELSDAEADRAGLVSTHAYAVLSVVEYKVSCWYLIRHTVWMNALL